MPPLHPTALVLALALGLGLVLALALAYSRVQRRARRELAQAREAHARALGALVGRQAHWATPPAPETWCAVQGNVDRLAYRLEAVKLLDPASKRVDYITRLTLTLPDEQRFPAAGTRPLRFALGHPSSEDAPSQALGAQLAPLAAEVLVEPQRLQITARPGGPVLARYSYAIYLELQPQRLRQLLPLGAALARQLLASDAQPPTSD